MCKEINASDLENIVDNFTINFEHRKNLLIERFENKRGELLPSLIKLTNFLKSYLNKDIDSMLFVEDGNFFINLRVSENNIFIWLANLNYNKESSYIALFETSKYNFTNCDIRLINNFIQCDNKIIIESLTKEINDKYLDF